MLQSKESLNIATIITFIILSQSNQILLYTTKLKTKLIGKEGFLNQNIPFYN